VTDAGTILIIDSMGKVKTVRQVSLQSRFDDTLGRTLSLTNTHVIVYNDRVSVSPPANWPFCSSAIQIASFSLEDLSFMTLPYPVFSNVANNPYPRGLQT
jgi:hypothetical protein